MKTECKLLLASMLLAFLLQPFSRAAEVTGEPRKWHKVTITFDGPKSSEQANPNPFLDYRLNVTFKHSKTGKSYLVPGYYAADGNAANTSADSGNKWRVHFAPSEVGEWKYTASFRKGKNVAVSEGASAGESFGFMDGAKGSLKIGPTDKTGRDMRAKGLLQYVGKHHLRFAETGEYFLKCGADAPENFLAYKEFDGDFKNDGHKDDLIKDWGPHIKDWRPGDPTWQNGKGKGIIGAVNYLASQDMNVFSFIPMNIAGDDRNVFPYTNYNERERLDCSRLDQWGKVFDHGNNMGMYLHFKTLETENELILDKGNLGPHRKLYYRELIARFSHNLALNWNLGEEINNASHEQKVAWANYFWTTDPYQHHIVIHNMGDPHYDLLGDASKLTGFSLQTSKPDFSQVHRRTLDYVNRSAAAGKPWVVACDEPGDATHGLITDAEDPTRDNARKNALWGNIMAGGAGVEWYFGYKHPHSDLTCQDYRTRAKVWRQCRYALDFFRKQEIPFWDMKCVDEMTANTDDYVLYKDGEVYLVYLKFGGSVKLKVGRGEFSYGWFNPQTGDGADKLLKAGKAKAGKIERVLKAPDKNDWLLVIRGSGKLNLASDQTAGPPPAQMPGGGTVLKAMQHFQIVEGEGLVPAYKDQGHNALAINPDDYKDKFAGAETTYRGKAGKYDITIVTMMETDGESTYRLKVDGRQIGTFTNPKTSQDYKPTAHTWKKVTLDKGAKIRIEFNPATNSTARQGNRKAYSRGRWTQLIISEPGTGVSVAPPGQNAPDPAAIKPPPVKYILGVPTVFEETDGIVAVEAEHFAVQTLTSLRRWYLTTTATTQQITPDGDPSHADSASGGAYLEVLPDTRRTHGDKLISGQNFMNEPGKMAVLTYNVYLNTPGRYYVWVRAYSTGSEDNGLHVGLDGAWPASGQRLQWCEGKKSWRWESKQRTNKVHCGEPYKIYLDVEKPGLHTISFSMREDGFEFDKWLMTKDKNFARPNNAGPAERARKG
ncbi:MAG: DUF5060 domain-containing protein [Planctomycetota bacterium]|jgi:hypothetical protein